MFGLDRVVFHWINQCPEWLSPMFVFLSGATSIRWVKYSLIALGLALIAYPKSRKATVLAAIAFPLADGLTNILKHAFPTERPYVDLADIVVRVGTSDSYGTASAHSANMAAVAFVFTYYHRCWGVPWVVIAFLTGLSRIYVGVHYPSQVVLGWVCGLFCAFLATQTWEAFVRARSGRVENVEAEPSGLE